VWVRPTPENARRVHRALNAFGAPLGDLTVTDLSTEGVVFQMGLPPNRIDVITAIDGVGFEEAWSDRIAGTYGDQAIAVIGRTHLLKNKLASGRPQDLVDARTLEEE
jgi:hypothetical protein